MIFSGKFPFHVAARLAPRFWVPHLLQSATIYHYSRLFAIIRTIRTIRTVRYSGLFAASNWRLFAIRVFQTPNRDIPRGTCWNVFQDGWTNQVTQVFRFSSLHQRGNWTFDTCPQKTPCHSCKQAIYHSTTTVPSSEIPAFNLIADQRRV